MCRLSEQPYGSWTNLTMAATSSGTTVRRDEYAWVEPARVSLHVVIRCKARSMKRASSERTCGVISEWLARVPFESLLTLPGHSEWNEEPSASSG